MPKELLDKVLATQKFNQGFSTTEYLAASILDQALHQLTPEDVPKANDLISFETDALKTGGIYFEAIPPRYRSAYFSHIIGGYSAGYYSYKWAEVLDADAFELFQEKGIFDKETARSFQENVLSKGGTEKPMTLYKRFRGQEPKPEALLKRAGLLT